MLDNITRLVIMACKLLNLKIGYYRNGRYGRIIKSNILGINKNHFFNDNIWIKFQKGCSSHIYMLLNEHNKPTNYEPIYRKILIYGSFQASIVSRIHDVKLCLYYQPYEIKWSNNVKDFDFDVVILYFDHHSRFMTEYLKIIPSRKRTMIVASIEPPFSVKDKFNYQISKDHFNHWTFNYYRSSFFTMTYGDY
ncbi:hypothetical protein MXB_1462, partial [Myxobolus squamalis]